MEKAFKASAFPRKLFPGCLFLKKQVTEEISTEKTEDIQDCKAIE